MSGESEKIEVDVTKLLEQIARNPEQARRDWEKLIKTVKRLNT